MIYLAVFALAFCADMLSALYLKAFHAKRVHTACMYSVAIGLVGTLAVLATVEDKWCILFESLGFYFGTWFIVRK